MPILPPAGGDLTGRSLFFETVEGQLSIALVTHPTDNTAKLLNVTASQLSGIIDQTRFVLIDRTGPARVKWAGTLRRYS